LSVREAQSIVDEELARLPEKYRAPLLLCCLEGRTRDEAARRLGWSAKLVKSRLEQGRDCLRSRLSRRGLTLPAALVATLLAEHAAPAALPAALMRSAVQIATAWPGKGISASVVMLANGAFGGMATVKAKMAVGLLLLAGVLAAGMGAFSPARPAAQQTEKPSTVNVPEPKPEKQSPPRTDRYGDPLPPGALARLGTLRWRHGDQVTAVAFSPDGATLASGSYSGEAIHLWEAKTGKLLRILFQGQHEGGVGGIFFTPDGKQLLAFGGRAGGQNARVWDVSAGKELRRWPTPGGGKFALSPDGKLLAGWGVPRPNRHTIVLSELATGKQVAELPFEGVQDYVRALAFSPDGKELVAGGTVIRLFDVARGRQLRTFGEGDRVNSVAFSPDGKTVAVARYKEPIALWDVATGKKLHQLDVDGGARVAFSHDGKTLAGCKPGFATIILWEAATGKKLRELPGQHYQVWDLAFSPDDKTLAVGNSDSQVRLWEVATGKELSSVGRHRGWVNVLAFTERDRAMASVSDGGIVCHWDVATSKVLRQFQEEETHCYCGDLSPDGRTLALGDGAGVHLFDWSTGKKLRLLKGHKLQVWAAVFSPKGDVLASSANMDQHILLWDVASGKALSRILTAYVHDLHSLAWSPDGKMLASAGLKAIANPPGPMDTVCLWDPWTGKPLREWTLQQSKDRHTGGVRGLTFSPDGKLLAAADGDNTIVVWHVAGGKMRARLPGHPRGIMALAFSPDCHMLASGGLDRTIRLWELATWKERRRYHGHLGAISKLAFSADGLTLASGSGDTSVLLWSIMDGDQRQPPPDLGLTPQQLEKLWNHLASEDASRAWGAVCALVKSPKQAVPWLKEHLKPPSAADLDRTKRLIADLNSDQFAVRRRAARELEKLGDWAEPAMRKALEKRPSLEVRRRLEQLLEKLEEPVRAAGAMRELRSLEVLEHTDTAEARAVLRSIAEGPPEARLTRAAKATLDQAQKRRHKSAHSN
jgi:WD40 repeat protein